MKFTNGGAKGSLGPLNPGWSVSEFATPVVPNERAGGTGTVSLSGGQRDDSLLLINNDASVEHDDEGRALGTISGVVRSVDETGGITSLTQDTALAKWQVDGSLPPLLDGNMATALGAAATVAAGDIQFTQDTGQFWPLAGNSIGFEANGTLVSPFSELLEYQFYDQFTSSFLTEEVVVRYGTVTASEFSVVDGLLYAGDVEGFPYQPGVGGGSPNPNNKMRLQGKTMLNGQDFSISMIGNPDLGLASGSAYQAVSCFIDYSAETATVTASVVNGGMNVTYTDTVSIAGLDLDAEIAWRFYFNQNTYYLDGSFPKDFDASFSVCNTSDYATIFQADLTAYSADESPLWWDGWTISGNCRALWYRNDSNSGAEALAWTDDITGDWEFTPEPIPFIIDGAVTAGPPAIGYVGNVWDYLQEACAAYGWELALENDVITARPVGGRILDLSNYAGSPTNSLSTTFTGRQVDVNYSNSSVVSNAEVYNALADDNRVLSVGANEVVTTEIQTDAYLTSVNQPTRTTSITPGAGEYFVVDSTGLPIVARQWEEYGGKVTATADFDKPGIIIVNLIGPSEEIPSTTAPYSLAVSDGDNRFAALSLVGSGVLADPKVLNLLTGADPDRTPNQIATTITSPFISSLDQAFDRGMWASLEASGPRMGLRLQVPVSAIEAFGVTPGKVFQWRDNIYRVTTCTVRSLNCDIEAVRFTAVADFDAVWDGETVADHDALWSGYTAEDQRVRTLKTTAW